MKPLTDALLWWFAAAVLAVAYAGNRLYCAITKQPNPYEKEDI